MIKKIVGSPRKTSFYWFLDEKCYDNVVQNGMAFGVFVVALILTKLCLEDYLWCPQGPLFQDLYHKFRHLDA